MSKINEWEQLVASNSDLQKKVIQSQEAIASQLEGILKLAAENGIDLTIDDLMSPSKNSSDSELAAASGGVNPCGVAAGGFGIACGIGAVFSLGATAAASSAGIAVSAGITSNAANI